TFHQRRARVCGIDPEFRVAIAPGLLTVGSKDIRPAGKHVAGKMFYENGDTVGLGVERGEELLIAHLRDGALRRTLQGTEFSGCGIDEFSRHGWSSPEDDSNAVAAQGRRTHGSAPTTEINLSSGAGRRRS